MRIWILLVALVLVGCAKPPTYLECTRGSTEGLRYVWLVIDHENKLFIYAKQTPIYVKQSPNYAKLSSNYDYSKVIYGGLNTQDTKYRFVDLEYERSTWTLDRKTLEFYALNSSSNAYNCNSVDDLSEIRAKGLEKARIKI